ncbi:YjbH domain-containing protein [Acidimangrovimonas pyrenivorans]|uniref:YjbH domain-containing protein n=1 Tax=Acidimangrovimonas pyrenivorans TaxID=2030798 RepID=A0ABV7AMT8_9RHOB
MTKTTRVISPSLPLPALVAATITGLATVGTAVAQPQQLSWGYNSYGVPGLIDMPQAFSREDAEFATQVFHFKNQTRINTTFQIAPRFSATFRYSIIGKIGSNQRTLYDRSFSLHYRFLDETRYRPAMAVGLNDIVGTGIYSGEYVVATKTVTPRLRATAGIGWGRLGSFGSFSNPLGALSSHFKTRQAPNIGKGGTFHPGSWFTGPAAAFGGIEWRATDKLRFIAEYSSDAYRREDGLDFNRRSPFNLALAYQLNPGTTVTGSYMYGSEFGLQFTHTLNPRRPNFGPGRDTAPPAIEPRPTGAEGALVVAPDDAQLAGTISSALAAQGLALDGLARHGKTLQIEIRNERYSISSQALGRAARVLSRTAPAQIDTFAITLARDGMPITTATLSRDDLESLAFHPVAPDLLRARTQIVDARHNLPRVAGSYPVTSWRLSPYLTPSLFDPVNPLRADLGVALHGKIEPVPGLVFSGLLHKKIVGNLDKATRTSNSTLPHVRSDANLYYKTNGVTVPQLTAAYYFRPGRNLFGRVTAGYLEPMFGGVSAEVLWKPQNSRLALGAEVNRVRQRGYDQLLDFRNYKVTTAHLSAYYDFTREIHGRLSVGRYLAGDYGATLELDRRFDNGWRIGLFATKTNVSAAQFGEGSFDKGIRLTIPLDWVTGKPSRTRLDTVIRPLTRDGGATLNVPGRLYDRVRSNQATTLDATWGRFWK